MNKDNAIIGLIIVALISIIGLLIFFNINSTGAGVYAQATKYNMYGEGIPMLNYNCPAGYVFSWHNQWGWCKPGGLRTETWLRNGAQNFPNPQVYEYKGYCCPIGRT